MDYQVSIVVWGDHTAIKGNVLALGDTPEDKEQEAEAERQVRARRSRTVWGWAVAQIAIEASYRGRVITVGSSEFLGGLSYSSANDFMKNSPYFQEMFDEAWDALVENLGIISEALGHEMPTLIKPPTEGITVTEIES